ncbi:hypothetical protein ES703_85879 [subsurface metagenome]
MATSINLGNIGYDSFITHSAKNFTLKTDRFYIGSGVCPSHPYLYINYHLCVLLKSAKFFGIERRPPTSARNV